MMKARALRWLGAIASGLSTAAIFPPFGVSELVWVSMLPLLGVLWSLGGRRCGWAGLGYGWLAGVAFFLPNLAWVRVVSPVGWGVLAGFLALYPALWGAFVARLAHPWGVAGPRAEAGIEGRIRDKLEARGESHWRQSARALRIAFAVAAAWCGVEWLRGWVFTGFGWNTLGVAFHETPVMAQAADLLGVCGLSFAPVFLQAVLWQTGRRMIREARGRGMKPHVDFGVAVLLLALLFLYGVWRLQGVGRGESIRLRVLLVQLNIPQEAARMLWSTEEIHTGYQEETLEALAELEREDVERFRDAMDEGREVTLRRPDWIMWPESALSWPVRTTEDGAWAMPLENLAVLERVQEERPVTLVFGLNELESVRFEGSLVPEEDARFWNSLVVLPPDGELRTFRKHHLVIFGEYIPLVEQLPFLRKIYEQQSGAAYGGAFSVGESLDPLPVEIGGKAVGLLPTVCFEDTVPRLVRRFVRGGPQLIVNVTNDGWFKDSPAAAQHFANARFRAIELRRPMLRCANTGVSAAVNAAGSSAHPETGEAQELRDADGSHLTRGWLLAEVDIPTEPPLTLYAVIGDWGVIVLGGLGCLAGVVGGRRS